MTAACPNCGAPTVEGVTLCGACNRPVSAPSAYGPPQVTWPQSVTPPGYGPAPAAPGGAPAPRPAGVTVLAILDFVGAGFAALFGVIAVLGGAAFGGALGGAEGAGVGAIIGGAIGAFAIGAAALAALIGWGLWTAKAWAWILTLVLQGIAVLNGAYSLVNGDFVVVFSLAISGLIIWYLLQPNVKAYFGQA